MIRLAAVALALFGFAAGEARAADFGVIVVPGLGIPDLARLKEQGAIGLLVPSAGPETSAELARAGLLRGKVAHSLRSGLPAGSLLIRTRTGPLGSADGPAIYVGLPAGPRQPNDRRYPVVVVGRGYQGILTSESTRIPGLVSIADVAPTAVGGDEALGHATRANAAADLLSLDERIGRNNDTRRAASLLVCIMIMVIAVVFPPAAVTGVAAALLANLALGIGGVSEPWPVMICLGLSTALGGALLAFAWTDPLRLGLGLAAVLIGYLLALGLDSSAVALSPLGPTQNARFYGLSNLLETLLLVPALGAAALLAAVAGWAAFGAVAALSLVTVAGNRFGADGGGAVVLAVGFAVLGVLLAGAGKRALAIALGAALALVLGLLALDVATGVSSHVTRALEDGPGGLAGDLRDRVVLSWERATDTLSATLAIALLTLALAVLVARTLLRRGLEPGTAVPLAVAAAVATSFVVNDSPLDVILAGLAAYLAADRGMLPARWPGPFRLRWSRSPVRSPS
jgi:hypothetical protein